MDDLQFSQIFPNGSQDSTTWTIAKQDLPGLVASASNSPGSLFVGLMLAFWYQNQPPIETDQGDYITTDNGDVIFCDPFDSFEDIQTIYWQMSFQNIPTGILRFDNLVVFSYAIITSS